MSENNDRLERATQAVIADSIVSPKSDELTEILEEYGNGVVKVFGQLGNRATRTEINLDGAKITVHKNTGQGEGAYSAAGRFNLIEVVDTADSSVIAHLDIKVDPVSSPTNPAYEFHSGDDMIGSGYGQRMDLQIAQTLTGVNTQPGQSNHTYPAIDWIREQVAEIGK